MDCDAGHENGYSGETGGLIEVGVGWGRCLVGLRAGRTEGGGGDEVTHHTFFNAFDPESVV